MNKKEFATFVAAMKAYYPKEKALNSQEQMQLWYQMLADIPADIAGMALQKIAATEKWMPSIAEIRQAAVTVQLPEGCDWSSGWDEAQKAMRKYGQYNAAEALASLSEITRETVKRLGFRNLCISENPAADRANFRMTYEQLAMQKKQRIQLPEALQKQIEGKRKELENESKGLLAASSQTGHDNQQ